MATKKKFKRGTSLEETLEDSATVAGTLSMEHDCYLVKSMQTVHGLVISHEEYLFLEHLVKHLELEEVPEALYQAMNTWRKHFNLTPFTF